MRFVIIDGEYIVLENISSIEFREIDDNQYDVFVHFERRESRTLCENMFIYDLSNTMFRLASLPDGAVIDKQFFIYGERIA